MPKLHKAHYLCQLIANIFLIQCFFLSFLFFFFLFWPPHGTWSSLARDQNRATTPNRSLTHHPGLGVESESQSCRDALDPIEPQRESPPPFCGSYVLFFFFFATTPVAYGSSQGRGRIGATAAGLHHSHCMQDLNHICNLHHSSWQRRILKSLNEARART